MYNLKDSRKAKFNFKVREERCRKNKVEEIFDLEKEISLKCIKEFAINVK